MHTYHLLWVSVDPPQHYFLPTFILEPHLKEFVIYGVLPNIIQPLYSQHHVSVNNIQHIKTISHSLMSYDDLLVIHLEHSIECLPRIMIVKPSNFLVVICILSTRYESMNLWVDPSSTNIVTAFSCTTLMNMRV